MAIDVPDPKVYTTKYENFRGVDFTNDQTNVWRRRSPTGVNMLPDASGRPFKRHGWEILISNAEICGYLGVESCMIQKCAWFELGGVDHIVIFTDCGVAFYNGVDLSVDNGFTAKCDDYDCYSGFDRCFFFEGNGTSAFYIYGNFKVWRYEADFNLHDVTDKLTVPTILISADAAGAGTFYKGYNIFGKMAAIEYRESILFTYWCSDGITITVSPSFSKTLGNVYKYTFNGSSWSPALPATIKVNGTPQDGDEIVVVYAKGVLLPNNASEDVSVWASTSLQYDTPLTQVPLADTLSAGEFKLHTDNTAHRANKQAWVEFYDDWHELVTGEDFIKVAFPSVSVNMTQYGEEDEEDCHFEGTASLVGV